MKIQLMLACIIGITMTASTALSAPIIYQGQLLDGIPQFGTINQPNSNPSNPVGAVYYSFFAQAGSPIVVEGSRIPDGGDFDMSFWLFQGLFSDTDDFGSFFDSGDAPFSVFADDEVADAGPFGDPRSAFNAPVTGFYTVAVTNFLSASNPPHDFQLLATGVTLPEPMSLALWGLASVVGVAAARRRRKQLAV